jgi:hypothetical protein
MAPDSGAPPGPPEKVGAPDHAIRGAHHTTQTRQDLKSDLSLAEGALPSWDEQVKAAFAKTQAGTRRLRELEKHWPADLWTSPPLRAYALAVICPKCQAGPGADCNPGRRAEVERRNRRIRSVDRTPPPLDRTQIQHRQRVNAAIRQKMGDIGRAPWPEERVPGERYDTIPAEVLADAEAELAVIAEHDRRAARLRDYWQRMRDERRREAVDKLAAWLARQPGENPAGYKALKWAIRRAAIEGASVADVCRLVEISWRAGLAPQICAAELRSWTPYRLAVFGVTESLRELVEQVPA